jgi:hypothetical protein
MIEKVLQFLGIMCILILVGLFTYILCNYVDLREFKKCYDINFQDTKCRRYINY